MERPPRTPRPPADRTPDPEAMRKRTQLAERLESALRWAGMSDEAITELRGDEERTGPGWQRLAKAVADNPYPGMDPKPNSKGKFKTKTLREGEASRPAMNAGLKFALEGSNLKESAYRYEYFKAIFNSEMKSLKKENTRKGINLDKSEEIEKISQHMTTPEANIQGKLAADIKTVEKMRKGGPVYIDPSEDREKILSLIREQADMIGMGDVTSTAYHARKHIDEIPAHEREHEREQRQQLDQEGSNKSEVSPVKDYLDSLARTLKEGEVVDFNPTSDGEGVQVAFRRVVEQARGSDKSGPESEPSTEKGAGKKIALLGKVYIRKNTGIQVATYGKDTENER